MRSGSMTLEDCEESAKGPWKTAEDDMLRDLIAKHGTSNWSVIAKEMIGRNGKSCRLRWFNQLCPELKKEPFTAQEDALIIEAHAAHGNRWSLIAKMLKGRTDNAVKNRWNSTLKRRVSSLGGAAAYASAHGSGYVPSLAGGAELQDLREHFDTVHRMICIRAEQAECRKDVDYNQILEHVLAIRAILLPALDVANGAAAAAAGPGAQSEALHFSSEPELAASPGPGSAWDTNPMRRLPGLAEEAKEAAARALEEDLNEAEASAYSAAAAAVRPQSSGNGYHSPELKAPDAPLSLVRMGSSLKRGREDFLDACQPNSAMSAMSTGANLSTQLAWHACAPAPRQMSAAANFAAAGSLHEPLYASRERIFKFADRLERLEQMEMEAQSSCLARHLQLGQPHAEACFAQPPQPPQAASAAHLEAQLHRRYSAPGSLRLEPEATAAAAPPPRAGLPLRALPPHAQAGKRARQASLPSEVFNPFNNCRDEGDFLFYQPGADGLEHFEQPLGTTLDECKESAAMSAEALPPVLR